MARKVGGPDPPSPSRASAPPGKLDSISGAAGLLWRGKDSCMGFPCVASVTEEMEGYRLRAVVWPAQCAGRAVSAPHFPSVLNFHCGRYVL